MLRSTTLDGGRLRRATGSICRHSPPKSGERPHTDPNGKQKMPSVVDITGMKFGPWTVIEPAQRPAGLRMQGAFWLCECDCVRKTREVLNGARLRAGRGAKGCYHCRKPCGLWDFQRTCRWDRARPGQDQERGRTIGICRNSAPPKNQPSRSPPHHDRAGD